jgi:hypothetical protein
LLSEASNKEREAEDLRRKMERIKQLFPEDERIEEKGRLIATTYQWMKAVTDAAHLKAQAELVRTLTPVLLDLPLAPPLPDPQPRIQNAEPDLG